jgi:hypothetical protein
MRGILVFALCIFLVGGCVRSNDPLASDAYCFSSGGRPSIYAGDIRAGRDLEEKIFTFELRLRTARRAFDAAYAGGDTGKINGTASIVSSNLAYLWECHTRLSVIEARIKQHGCPEQQ